MISIIIPSRNEPFLQQTIDDLASKAKGEIEIIVSLDGYWPSPPLKENPKLKLIHRGKARGMRASINSGVAIAKGEYILKCDAHTMWDEGYDVKLVADIQDNWVVVPRRKRLDPVNWKVQDVGKVDIDYMYLSYPSDKNDYGGPGLHGRIWEEKNRDASLKNVLIDDLMSSQGSAYFMKRDYFYHLELLDEANYGTFPQEFQEVGLKCWLSGGEVKINKKTWYAHWHKGKTADGKSHRRGYFLDVRELKRTNEYVNRWMIEKVWHKQTKPFQFLIDKFKPVPGWT